MKFSPYQRVVLFLLTLVMVFNLIDRQVIFILAENIRIDLGLTDAQLGLLGGVAFSLVYAVAALPIARYADKSSRTRVLALCITLWSLMTALGAAAQNLVQLALTRCGVALGEAGANPASQSIISDIFPPPQRVRALAILQTGVPIGIMVGLAGGGWMAENYHWRTVLLCVAAPSLLLAPLCIWLIKEGTQQSQPRSATDNSKLFQEVGQILNIPGMLWILAGVAVFSFASFSSVVFGAVFMIRLHAFSVSEAGLVFGLITGFAGFAATLMWGYLAEKTSRTRHERPLLLVSFSCAVATPLYIAAWTVNSSVAMLVTFSLAWIMTSAYLPLSNAMVQNMVPPHLRAQAASLVLIAMSGIGNVAGATMSGMLSDHLSLEYGDDGLRIALSIASSAGLLGALCYWLAARKVVNGSNRTSMEAS